MRTFFQCRRNNFDVWESAKVVSAKRPRCMRIDLYAKRPSSNSVTLKFGRSKLPANQEIESAYYFNFCFVCQFVSPPGCQPSVSVDFFVLSCHPRLSDIEVCQAICSITLIFLVNIILDHECCRG